MASDLNWMPSPSNAPIAVMLRMDTPQTTNTAAGDHLKFDTVQVDLGGSFIFPDVATGYTNGGGASIGRVAVQPNVLYRLELHVPYVGFSLATGNIAFHFYDVTSDTVIKPSGQVNSLTDGTNEAEDGSIAALYFPRSPALLEVRIAISSAITQIGYNTSPQFLTPSLIITAIR